MATIINSETSTTASPGNGCGVHVMPGCTCANSSNSTVNIFCNKIGLRSLPSLDFGRLSIHMLSFQGNHLTNIDTGDFFGLKVERLLLGNNSLSELDLLSFWGLEKLQSLDLSYNKLRRVPSDALRLLRNLRTLTLTGNRIKALENFDFMNLGHLEVLSLDKNPLSVIEADAFSGTKLFLLILDGVHLNRGLEGIPKKELGKLKSLSIADSGISKIPDLWFLDLPCLRSLNLDNNDIRDIPDNAFDGIGHSLTTLEINGNKLKRLSRASLRKLVALESLEASHNRLRRIYARTFNASKNLMRLDLSHNSIKDVSPFAFEGMDNIATIDLRVNQMITLDERIFTWEGARLRAVHLAENPWLCNCLLQWMKKDYRKKTPLADVIADLTSLKCKRPEFLAGKPIVRVPVKEFTCDHDYYYYYDDYEYDP